MDVREDIRRELSFKREDMLVPGREVLEDVTGHLKESDWNRIEGELKRAIR